MALNLCMGKSSNLDLITPKPCLETSIVFPMPLKKLNKSGPPTAPATVA